MQEKNDFEPFQCSKCGLCCSEFSKKGEIKSSDGVGLFEWEKNKLEEIAKNLGITLNIEPHAIFKFKNVYLAYRYILREQPCPFLKNNSCTIYSDRPTKCKIFPILGLDLDDHAIDFGFLCPALNNAVKERLLGTHESNEYLKLLLDYFGKDLILLAHQEDYTRSKILYLLKNVVRAEPPIEYDSLSDIQKENIEVIPFFTFCKKHNLIPKAQIKSIIRQHNSLEDVQRLSSSIDSL